MTDYKDQPFNTRFSTMGDVAETAYEEWAESHDIRFDRFGHNRPRSNMFKWPAFIRYAPDYITHDRLVEVKGCGRDRLAKIKAENLQAMREWGEWMPVSVFLWNSAIQEHAFFDIDHKFMNWVSTLTSNRFPDNDKIYFEIPFSDCQAQVWTTTPT